MIKKIALLMALALPANAALIDNNDGTVTIDNLMVMTDLNPQNVLTTHNTASIYASVYDFAGYDDWRLATIDEALLVWANFSAPPFFDVANVWLSDTRGTSEAAYFHFGYGVQSWAFTNSEFSIMAVRDVSSVPVPAALWLFGSGLLGLVGVARRC